MKQVKPSPPAMTVICHPTIPGLDFTVPTSSLNDWVDQGWIIQENQTNNNTSNNETENEGDNYGQHE